MPWGNGCHLPPGAGGEQQAVRMRMELIHRQCCPIFATLQSSIFATPSASSASCWTCSTKPSRTPFLNMLVLAQPLRQSGMSGRGPWSGAGCTPLVSWCSHLQVQHAGLLGCAGVPGLSRGVTGCSFPSAPQCSALSLDTRPGLASQAGSCWGAGMQQIWPLPVERRSDTGTVPTGLISPTNSPGLHRQSLFF